MSQIIKKKIAGKKIGGKKSKIGSALLVINRRDFGTGNSCKF